MNNISWVDCEDGDLSVTVIDGRVTEETSGVSRLAIDYVAQVRYFRCEASLKVYTWTFPAMCGTQVSAYLAYIVFMSITLQY